MRPHSFPNCSSQKVKVKSLSHVQLFVAHLAPPSMGFSRQEYWSGLSFLSPGDLPDPRIKPRPPALQADSLPAEPPGKPKNTGMGSLSLLQQIFPTQESNWGFLCCRWILYQLRYQRNQCLPPAKYCFSHDGDVAGIRSLL